jgi:inner membrane protein
MDSLTQIVLGAAVSELAIGKKVGNKALFWGAVCGTIPDLDVLLSPFLSDLQELSAHRGFSHSIVFSCLLAPLIGTAIWFLYEKKEANWIEWTLACFLALVTHPLLDCFTNYGTQLFLPFSNYRVALNSIFIVDPGYTVPMMLCLIIVSFIKRAKPARSLLNKLGMGISHAYLLFSLGNKLYMGYVFESALEKKCPSFTRYMTNPMPFQNLLWTCIAEDASGFYIGYYSLLDKKKDLHFRRVSKNNSFANDLESTFAMKRLYWFSNGYLCFTRKEGKLYANDLRFGKTGILFNNPGEFVFQWNIKKENGNVDIEASQPSFQWNKPAFEDLKNRIKGIKKDSL